MSSLLVLIMMRQTKSALRAAIQRVDHPLDVADVGLSGGRGEPGAGAEVQGGGGGTGGWGDGRWGGRPAAALGSEAPEG